MYNLLVYGAIITACYVLFAGISNLRDTYKAKQLGCQPAHRQKNRLPLGWDQLQRLLQSNRAGILPDDVGRIFREEGHYTFTSHMLGSRMLNTAEPKNIQALLATQFKDFDLGERRRLSFFPLLGNGIFTVDGKYWEHSRAMIRPQFARDQVADLELEETHVQELLKCISTGADGWTGPVNIAPLFFRLTLDSATEFLFGISVHSQRQQIDNSEDFEWKDLGTCFDTSTRILGERFQLLDFYWVHNPQVFRDGVKEVHRFADFCVQDALHRYHNSKQDASLPSTGKQRYTFLDELVKVTQDPIEIRSQLLNVLVAGRDTTASLLSWAFWLLARHPEAYHQLRTSILNDFGPYSAQTDRITFASLKSCAYLQHVLNEVLRLYPSVPMNARRANKDTTIPVGGGKDGLSPVFVKKGEEVGYSVCVMHRLEEYWGPDAEEFNPGRWAGRKYGWEYLPFNGGPRICLGQQFALTEAGYVMVRLVQRFDRLRLGDESLEPPLHRLGLTDAPAEYTMYLHEGK